MICTTFLLVCLCIDCTIIGILGQEISTPLAAYLRSHHGTVSYRSAVGTSPQRGETVVVLIRNDLAKCVVFVDEENCGSRVD